MYKQIAVYHYNVWYSKNDTMSKSLISWTYFANINKSVREKYESQSHGQLFAAFTEQRMVNVRSVRKYTSGE